MANPQKEKGYTRLSNEILEALARTPLRVAENSVILAVFRKTYGWNKKADNTSIQQIQDLTGYSRRMVIYTVQNLEAKNMLTVVRARGENGLNMVNSIAFQKDYDKWVVQGISPQYAKTLEKQRKSYKKRVVQGKRGSARKHTLVVQGLPEKAQILAPTKDKHKQKTKTADGPQADPNIPLIIDLFKTVNPSYSRLFGMPPQRSAVERLLKQHGFLKLSAMVLYLPKSNASKYAPTITTPAQFELKLGELIAWSQKQKESTGGRGLA